MAITEFQLIDKYFNRKYVNNQGLTLGVGDDAAILSIPEDQELIISSDTMVETIHFFEGADPEGLGHKALAVSLSDCAAMGADPRWVLLNLTLPEADESWLSAFSKGFFALADRYNVVLIGGDTTRGPLSMSTQILGLVPKGQALRRSGAQVGDLICVSGELGSAGAALAALKGEIDLPEKLQQQCEQKLHKPEPRVELGLALCGIASSCIDVSDGLLADLGHICKASGVGAQVGLDNVPISEALTEMVAALSVGDDYELCFTSPAKNIEVLRLKFPAICVIGEIIAKKSIIIDGDEVQFSSHLVGYQHF